MDRTEAVAKVRALALELQGFPGPRMVLEMVSHAMKYGPEAEDSLSALASSWAAELIEQIATRTR